MQQKTPDELADWQGHDLAPLRVPVVLPSEADLFVGHRDEPIVGDGDPVRVAAEIIEHLMPAEWPLGVDDPFETGAAAQLVWRAPISTPARKGKEDRANVRIEIVERNDDERGLVVLPRRWLVKRIFSCFGRYQLPWPATFHSPRSSLRSGGLPGRRS